MARQVQVLPADDRDGSQGERAVRFGLGGTGSGISLTAGHAGRWVSAAWLPPGEQAARRPAGMDAGHR